ncbi:hypothetical protein GCM10009779_60430 [Polymorphospora rubra]|uniref:Uncharacterized protein n=1 Tax=Polymorphospora rubra TaxID=338584 RepID=A0A810MTW1_9ACTN|nr:hypothetical protein Prubr_04900 [Polymorphospora rubra]
MAIEPETAIFMAALWVGYGGRCAGSAYRPSAGRSIARHPLFTRPAAAPGATCRYPENRSTHAGGGHDRGPRRRGTAQWNESPQAQEFCALGLSMVKPCASIRSAKSMLAPAR